jgi:hypothetical protein
MSVVLTISHLYNSTRFNVMVEDLSEKGFLETSRNTFLLIAREPFDLGNY